MSSTFRNRLLEAMQLRDMNQADLAKATGLSKPRISQYVNGTYEAKQQALYLLSEALHVNVSWLMGNDSPIEVDCDKLCKEVDTCEMIQKTYGKQAFQFFQIYLEGDQKNKDTLIEYLNMFIRLDEKDQAEIKGEMKQMLKNDKYGSR